jgi:hypothetical protein
MTRQFFRIDWPPRNLFLLIASTFGAFLALEGFLLRVFGDLPLTLTPWEVLFWTALLVWSIRVEVRLPLSASMSQLFLFALALVVLTPPWFGSCKHFDTVLPVKPPPEGTGPRSIP